MRKATSGFKKPQPAPVKTMPEPRGFNAEECAIYLGMSNNHIENELRAGKIAHRWVAGARVIDRKDADAYFDSLPYAPEGPRPLRSMPDDQLRSVFTAFMPIVTANTVQWRKQIRQKLLALPNLTPEQVEDIVNNAYIGPEFVKLK